MSIPAGLMADEFKRHLCKWHFLILQSCEFELHNFSMLKKSRQCNLLTTLKNASHHWLPWFPSVIPDKGVFSQEKQMGIFIP